MPDGMRSALMLRCCLEVLDEAGDSLHGREVIERLIGQINPTPAESKPVKNGTPRWEVNVRFLSGDAATLGWLVKQDSRWWITEAGRATLQRFPSADDLYSEFLTRLREVSHGRKRATTRYSGDLGVIADALALVPAGLWTSHDDLGDLVGGIADDIAHLLADQAVENAHRVLRTDGTVPPAMHQHFRHRGADLAKRLEKEGVQFSSGAADQAQRVTSEFLRERLDQSTSQDARKRAWLVRGANVDGVNVVPIWLNEGCVSLAASQLPEIDPATGDQQLRAIVAEGYRHKSYSVREKLAGQFSAFLRLMRVDDFVVTVHRGDIVLGVVEGEPRFVQFSDHRTNLRRDVRWLNAHRPTDLSQAPAPLPNLIQSQDDVVDLTDGLDALERLYAPLLAEGPPRTPAPEARLSEVPPSLADDLLIDIDWLVELRDVLAERRQIVLYGPPGTGKTFVAQRMAEHLAEPHAVKLIQFHPSYTYEDFFEGFRPESRDDGTLRFKLTSGPLRTIADEAREHPSTAYILIVDEINRGNLAKIFGELYFLLEYREQRIRLQYSSEDFTLPSNLYLIGTMNTADRSIALVDAAMRRRFAFVEMHPTLPPIAGLLRRWLTERGLSTDAADLLDELNARLVDVDYAIGPSYLMRESAHANPGGLHRIWRHDILPLLVEHHFGDDTDVVGRYGLNALGSGAGQP